jgi:hypothetical protein
MAFDVRKAIQDAAYIAVGVGVLAFQRAQVSRRETRARLEQQRTQVRSRVEGVAREVRNRVEPIAEQLQGRLPEQLNKALETGRARLQGVTGSAA